MAPLYRRGDIVAFARAQTAVVTVANASATANEPHALTLDGRAITFLAPLGAAPAVIAAGLVTAGLEQTRFSIASEGASLAIVGAIGRAFTVEVTPNLASTTLVAAVVAPLDREGLWRVQWAQEFWTRDPSSREIVSRTRAVARQVDGGRVINLFDDEVQTLVEAA